MPDPARPVPPEPGPAGGPLLATAARGGMTGFAGAVIGRLLAFVLQVLVSRQFGPEYYGLFITGFLTCQVLQILSGLGLQKGGMRFLSIAHEQKDLRMMRLTLRTAALFPLLSGALVALLLYLSAPWIALSAFHSPAIADVLRRFAFAVPFFALLRIGSDLSRAFKTTRYAVLVEDLLFGVLHLLFFLLFRAAGLGFFSVVYSFGLSSLLSSFLMLWIVRRQLRRFAARAAPEPAPAAGPQAGTWWTVLAYSLPLAPLGLLLFADNFLDIVMLNILSDPASVGQYAAAARWVMLFAVIGNPANLIFGPLLAAQYGIGRIDQIRLLYRAATRWMFALSLPLFLFLLVGRVPLMRLFGTEFALWGPAVLATLIVGRLSGALSGGAGLLLTVSGLQYAELACIGAGLGINFLLNWLWIPRYGVLGAAAATSLSNVLTDVARLLVVRRYFHCFPFTRRFAVPVLVGLILCAAGLALHASGPQSALVEIGVACAAAGLSMLSFLLAGLEPEDKELLLQLRQRLAARPPPPREA